MKTFYIQYKHKDSLRDGLFQDYKIEAINTQDALKKAKALYEHQRKTSIRNMANIKEITWNVR